MGIFKFTACYLYAPIFFGSSVGLALFLVENGGNTIWLAALLVLAIALSFFTERILPYEPAWNKAKGDQVRDWLHAIVNEFSIFIVIASIPFLASLALGLNLWPDRWPLWAQLAMAILVADFGITMTHYASHKIKLLWRLHAVHHSVERMYGFNGLLKHPLHQTLELMAGTTPLLLIGVPVEIAALLGFSVAIQLLLQHSNVNIRLGPLIYLWAIAPGHRLHHVASKTEGDVNFGLFTMIWDHLLGTFVRKRPQPRDGDIGIAGRPDFPSGYVDQLIEPFRHWE